MRKVPIRDRGWIVVNHGIPVFPTLSTTRKGSIENWEDGWRERGLRWNKERRAGHVECRRVNFEVV